MQGHLILRCTRYDIEECHCHLNWHHDACHAVPSGLQMSHAFMLACTFCYNVMALGRHLHKCTSAAMALGWAALVHLVSDRENLSGHQVCKYPMLQATRPGGGMWGMKEFVVRQQSVKPEIVAKHKSLFQSTTLPHSGCQPVLAYIFIFKYFARHVLPCKTPKVKLDLKGSKWVATL